MPALALRYDFRLYAADLADPRSVADPLETEVLIALLSEARVAPSEVPPGKLNRGWWGDSLRKDGEQLGSRLWLLEDATATDTNARRAETYAREALAFLVRARRARKVDARAELVDGGILLYVSVTRLAGSVTTSGPHLVNHANAWRAPGPT